MVAVEMPPEVIVSFVAEARSYLPFIAESLVALEDEEQLAEAYRFAHTIRSSAAMMGAIGLSQVAELLEGDLEAFQLGEPAAPPHLAQLGRSVERIGRLLAGVAGEPVDVDAIIEAEVADRTALLDDTVLLDSVDALAGAPANDVETPASDISAIASDIGPVNHAHVDAGEFTRTNSGDDAIADGHAGWHDGADAEDVHATAAPAMESVPLSVDGDTSCHSERSEESEWSAIAAPPTETVQIAGEEILRFAQDDTGPAQDGSVAALDGTGAALDHTGEALDHAPAQPVADPGAVSTLVDELAETVLALGRELATGGTDLQGQHRTLATWLRRFERAAGLRRRRVRRPRRAPLPAINAIAAEPQTPATPAIEPAAMPTLVELDPRFESEPAPTPDLVELDSQPENEAVLRRTIEAELRFQIEEEVRARLAREAPAVPRQGTAIRLGSSLSAAPEPVPAVAAEPEPAIEEIDIDPEMREVFALEATEHLKRIDAEAAALAADAGNTGARAALRRAVHTLKGAAAMMGFQAVATLAHSLEDRLEEPADQAAGGAPLAVGDILQDLDKLEALVQRCLGNAPTPVAAPVAAPVATPLAPLAASAPAMGTPMAAPPAAPPTVAPAETPAAVTAVPVRLDHLDDLLRVAGETSVSVAAWPALIGAANGALAELRQTVGRVQSLVATLGEEGTTTAGGIGSSAGTGSAGRPTLVAESSGEAAAFDPLELDRYTMRDYLLHDLAEIAADAHSAEREMSSVIESGAELVTAQRRQAAEVQERLLAARLVPLDELGGRLQRAARGVASRRKKQIEFIFTGGEVAVDRAILDSVADALLHLVRNASDHGIEAPDVRLGQNKPAAGTIHVTARQEQGEVILEVADDGRGIDPSRMAGAARAAGLDPATLTLEQAIELIFRPGVSTAGKVDDVSGRGVGLDAVREAIERVRGTIEVLTEPGQGTLFSLRFPVTLAQARVVMTETAGNPLALPAASVRRVARLRDLDTERSGASLIARHEGEAYAVADLATALGIAHEGAPPANPPVLFVEAAGKRAALITGAVGTQRDVVVKPLGSHLRAVRGVSGAALLQDGRVALLLHLPDVLAGAATIGASRGLSLPTRGAAAAPVESWTATRAQTSLQVLVVDDSPTIRKLLVRTLKDLGWRTVEAKDGVEALERIRVDRPDVVLSDIEMPHLDGYGLLSALRAKPETAELPVVMLTSRTAERHRQRAAELGASGYLTKPYRPVDVVAVLRQVGFGDHTAAVA